MNLHYTCGVPQGFILGERFFSMYVYPLLDIQRNTNYNIIHMQTSLKCILYNGMIKKAISKTVLERQTFG